MVRYLLAFACFPFPCAQYSIVLSCGKPCKIKKW
nr:MAG TPA: hypothetical protein [Caudoviricetes sp.]